MAKKPARKPAKKTAKKTDKKTGMAPRKPMIARRADLGTSADPYFAKVQPAELNTVAARLRDIVRTSAPEAKESIKWGMPFYELDDMLAYIKAQKKYITLGFYHQGIHLDDPNKRLEGTGKNMRHVKVFGTDGIDDKLFRAWIKQAAAINAKG
jgi:hypothetical protein